MCNSENIFVNLPHTILSKIISYLEDSLDVICFSLVCKRWYLDRDHFLLFNNILKSDIDYLYCKSYINQIKQSLRLKSNCTLSINSNRDVFHFKFDYIHQIPLQFDKESIENLKIPDDVTVLEINYSVKEVELLPYLYSFIEKSNVTSLIINNQAIRAGYIPPCIKNIHIFNLSNQLEPGYLPESLEVLRIGYISAYKLYPGVLPKSLRKLVIDTYDHILNVGDLPPNLEELSIQNRTPNPTQLHIQLSDKIFPSTLTKINCPAVYMPLLKPLPSLKQIDLYHCEVAIPINLENELPTNLTRLTFSFGDMDLIPQTTNFVKGRTPSNITYLSYPAGNSKMIISPETHYQCIQFYCNSTDEFKLLPPNIEYLEIIPADQQFGNQLSLKPGMIPPTVKHLLINGTGIELNTNGCIPSSVQTLNLMYTYFRSGIPPSAFIPKSVKTLIIGFGFLSVYPFSSIPKTVNTIKITDHLIRRMGYHIKCTFTLRRLDNENMFLMFSDVGSGLGFIHIESDEKDYLKNIMRLHISKI